MCRYGFKTYETHYGCFECRKVFKKPPITDLPKDQHNQKFKCPQCGQPMADLGLDFRAPKKTDLKAWRAIAGMYRIGHNFHSCGCSGIGFIPKNLVEYQVYLKKRLKIYEQSLEQVQALFDSQPDEKHKAVRYWASKIDLIKCEMVNSKYI